MSERVVILGVGLHPFGRHPEKSVGELARGAALAALKDARGEFKDAQAGLSRPAAQGGGGGAEGGYQAKMGINLMPALYAMMAQRHMHLYGTKHEHFAQVSVKSHRNGALNPNAQYQKALTLEDVLNSRMIP